jgi:sugar phosphate isomerase/epimerase
VTTTAAANAPSVSLSTGSLWGMGLRRTWRLASSAGFDAVELVVDPEVLVRGPAWVRDTAGRSGLAIASVHPFLYALPGYLGAMSSPPRLVRLAAELGAGVVTVHPAITRQMGGPEWQVWCRSMDEARRLAQDAGVVLSVENPPVFTAADRGKALARMADLVDFCMSEGLVVTYDTSHAWSAGDDVLEACRMTSQRLANVHLSDVRLPPARLDRPLLDSFFKHHQVPGEGILPLEAVMALLVGARYSGPLTLELSPFAIGWPRPAAVRNRLAGAVDWVRSRSGPAP